MKSRYRDRNYQSHVDDLNLPSLIQRICRREENIDRRLFAAGQMLDFISKPDNQMFFMKNMLMILNSLIDVFFEKNEATLKKQVAKIIALLGHNFSSEPQDFFQWIIIQLKQIANDKVRNCMLEIVYKLFTMDSEEKKYSNVIGPLLAELQAILEKIDDHYDLPFCIKPLILIAQNYPLAFRDQFHDIVDILVGWHIDHLQKMSLTVFASTSLIKLHTHWLNEIMFSKTLLSNFLEDMEGYLKAYQTKSQVNEYLEKIAALQRVFSTVVRSIGAVVTANSGTPINENFLLDALNRIVNCSQQVGKHSVELFRASNECVRLLLGAIHWKKEEMVSETILQYAIDLVKSISFKTNHSKLLLTLDFLIIMVQEIGSVLPVQFIKSILRPEAPLLQLKYSRNKVYCNELLALYQASLTFKSLPLLQVSYINIAGEFQETINQLLLLHHDHKNGDLPKLLIVPDNPYKSKITEICDDDSTESRNSIIKGKDEAKLLKSALFNIVSLLELADVKNSLIGMYGLSPNIFELFYNSLMIIRDPLSAIYPSLQYSILQVLYSHCQRHKNFTTSYIGESSIEQIIRPIDVLRKTSLGDVTSATRRHYPSILELLSTSLLSKSSSFSSRSLILHWCCEILQRLEFLKDPKLLEATGFSDLIYAISVAGLQNVPQHSVQSVKCLVVTQQLLHTVSITTFGNSNLSKHLIQRSTFEILYDLVVKSCIIQLWNSNLSVQNTFGDLLTAIPLDKVFSVMKGTKICDDPKISCKKSSTSSNLSLYGFKKSWMAKRSVKISTNSSFVFQSHHLTDFLYRLLQPTSLGNSLSSDWVKNLFWSCQRRNPHLNSHPYNNDESVIFSWVMMRAAEHIVANKLRTSFGKPDKTLHKIEGVIRDYVKQITTTTPQINGNGGGYTLRHIRANSRTFNLVSWTSLQRPHLLLQFLNNLEKLMYNAYEGCAVSLPPPTKVIKTFFYTNRQVCEHWLNRVRLAVMRISLSSGSPASAFQHGEAVLQVMFFNNDTSGFQFESAISMYVEALVELGAPDAIEGVYKTCRNLGGSNKKWGWIRAAKSYARGSYEDAICEFRSSLGAITQKPVNKDGSDVTSNSETDDAKKTSSSFRLFAAHYMTRSYLNLKSYVQAQDWVKETSKQDTAPSFINNINYLQMLNKFDIGEFEVALEASQKLVGNSNTSGRRSFNGQFQMNDLGGLSNPWKWSDLQCACETLILNYAMRLKDEHLEDTNSVYDLQQVIDASLGCIKLQTFNQSSPIPSNFQTLHHLAHSIKKAFINKTRHIQISLSNNVEDDSWLNSSSSNLLLNSMNYLTDESCPKTKKPRSVLRMAMMRAHRKKSNFNRAFDLLHEEFLQHGIPLGADIETLVEVCKGVSCEKNASKYGRLHLKCEAAKLLSSSGRNLESIELLADTLSSYLQNAGKSNSEICCRGLLNLTRSLQSEWKTISPDLSAIFRPSEVGEPSLISLLRVFLNFESKLTPVSFANNANLFSEIRHELVLGSLYNLATTQAPDLAKSWLSLAGWCFKWGKKTIDSANTSGKVELFADEKQKVAEILSPYTNEKEHLDEIYKVLRRSHSYSNLNLMDDLQQESTNLIDSTNSFQPVEYEDINEVVLNQFRSNCGDWLSRLPRDIINSLMETRQKIHARVFIQLNLAASAYFKFLNLNAKQQSEKYQDGTVIATLRLLRLLAKHALELKSTLEKGFESTPADPWNGIIPQLFSRLNHPESNVRSIITNLLCRIANKSQHLIIYPVVVATTRIDIRSQPLRTTFSDQENNDVEEKEEEEVTVSCYKQVLQSLLNQNPSTVQDVQLLVSELRRITLLWDELWLGTLNQHQQDIMRRLQQLNDEAKRVNNNTTLTKQEKELILSKQREAIMRPVIYSLGRVCNITSKLPETPHEKWFADAVQPMVVSALEKMKTPLNPNNPRSCWAGFKQLHSFLDSRNNKRPFHSLSLADLSPKLMALQSTSIPLPGVSDSSNNLAIHGFSSSVTILPTKTKPKKLQFIGTDGKRYNYLFKGLEDLHLDERIMQFLSTTNRLLHRQHGSKGYVARHYAVTPLGPRSGLIQWVDGATPLFALYKRWQQRQAARNSTNSQPNPTLRPSELFYNKLDKVVKKSGVDLDRLPRKEWPREVLRSVFDQLQAETPNNLLQKEIYCSSSSAEEYWLMQQKYTHSTAVMSMIGYVIGLGDRHLDNVLIDLNSGEVVHIDYNVCFEKGLHLRIPEKVPFRLTQNLIRAFGITGIHGTFKSSCEQVMHTLRKGRETLVTMLEAFIYDPLVDWTGTIEGGYAGAVYGGEAQQQLSKQRIEEDKLSKKDMERDINRSLLSSRVAEIKQAWYKNRDDMVNSIPIVISQLENYQTHFTNYQKINERIEQLLETKLEIKSALSEPRHPIRSICQRWPRYQFNQMKKDQILTSLQRNAKQCEAYITSYRQLLTLLANKRHEVLFVEVISKLDLGPCPFRKAFNFLQSAGQANTVGQVNMTDKELLGICEKRRQAQKNSLEVLRKYALIANEFSPQAAIFQHRFAIWMQRFKRIADCIINNDSESCEREIDSWKSKEFFTCQASAASSADASLKDGVTYLEEEIKHLVNRRLQVAINGINKVNQPFDRSVSDIYRFIRLNGEEGLVMIIYAITSSICTMANEGIQMEKRNASVKHQLVKQTSKDGDWFLEELSALFSNIREVLMLHSKLDSVQINSNHNFMSLKMSSTFKQTGANAILCVEKLFKTLQNLFKNFRDIIVPEASRLLRSEEPTTLKLVSSLNGILQDVKPDDLMKTLTSCLRSNSNTTNMDSVLQTVEDLKKKYDQLVEDSKKELNDERQSQGGMLLQAFNGVFFSVGSDFKELLIALKDLQILNSVTSRWRVFSIFQEALSLQKFKNLLEKERLVNALMFVKQIQTMHGFFALTQQNAKFICVKRISYLDDMKGFYSNNLFYSEARLWNPIKFFISFFVQELLIGLPSEALAYTAFAYLETWEPNIAEVLDASSGSLFDFHLSIVKDYLEKSSQVSKSLETAVYLIYTLNRVWRSCDQINRIDAHYDSCSSRKTRIQQQLARLRWLHEDLLVDMDSKISDRSLVISNLQKEKIKLKKLNNSVLLIQERMSSQHTSIVQRLKWAVGANPPLQAVLTSVDSEVSHQTNLLKKEENLSENILNLLDGVISFEQDRFLGDFCKDNRPSDEDEFMRIFSQTQEICSFLASNPVKINEVEKVAVDISPPNSLNVDDWLKKTSEKISGVVSQDKSQKHLEEQKMLLVKNSLRAKVSSIKQLLSSNNRLLTDVKTILKTILKEEEASEDLLKSGDHNDQKKLVNNSSNNIREFMERYKEVNSSLNTTLMDILQGCEDTTLYPYPLIEKLSDILTHVYRLYNDLVSFASPTFQQGTEAFGQATFATAVRSGGKANLINKQGPAGFKPNGADLEVGKPLTNQRDEVSKPSSTSNKSKNKSRDPKTGKMIQVRNNTALSVWKKVKHKLDCKDGSNKRITIAEQVQQIISEATDPNNLALLYEGWTSWV